MAIQDVIAELNRIKDAGLITDYAIGGAMAVQEYVEASATDDIDVFLVFGENGTHPLAPLGPIWADLTEHGAKVDGEYLVISDWKVQFLPPGTPLYDDAIQKARPMMFGNQEGRIMGPEHLAAMAVHVGRRKDYVRVEELVRRRKLDDVVLNSLIDKFGLREKWNAFQSKYLTDYD